MAKMEEYKSCGKTMAFAVPSQIGLKNGKVRGATGHR